MIDDRTPNLSLPLPSGDNLQTEDIPRLRSAFGTLDAAVAAKADLVGGKVPAAQLPSYVDDVLEHANLMAFPATGEAGKIYLALDSGLLYRWSGSAYVDLPANYELPSATPSTLGGIKVGSGLTVGPDGLLSTVGGGAGSGLPVFGEVSITPTSNGQTVFTPAGGYSAGQIEMFLNGVLLLGNGDDYTATDGVNITLTTGVNTTDTLFLRRWIYLPEVMAVAKTGDTMAGAMNWAAPVSVASAGTCNIGLAASNLVTITGATTITSLGVIAAGVQRTAVFSGALTLTYGAGLILPGGVSIVTEAGDAAVFQSLGGGIWRCTSYQRADGGSVLSAAAARASIGARVDRETIHVISVSTTAARSTTCILTASLTLTLPSSPSAGDWVTVVNRSGTLTCVIARNGQNIMGLAEDMTLDHVSASITLIFSDATRGWVWV